MSKAKSNTEIERKFLVDLEQWRVLDKPEGLPVTQCYLTTDPDKTVRIRVMGDQGFLTIKGRSATLARPEFEYEIPVSDARDMMALFGGARIEKTRYRILVGQHNWDVDEFYGTNAGLIVAEIELGAEDEVFEKPTWATQEVSEDVRYHNSQLLNHPYTSW